jgi:glycosyltransferase involved in cell wall biosynthesis
MKIVYLAAGAGGMYCGTCLHANALATALGKAGQDILLVPVYTPLRTDEENVSLDRVVFGGVNVYLQQRFSFFRHTPWLFDRLLDRPALLRQLAGRSSTVRPESLGDLCVSMLKGEQGRQRKELEKLLLWLAELRPEIVHLSTVLLAGMARQITRRLGIPVVSALSGEDTFLDRLPEPYGAEARAVLRERAADLAALIAPSRYFADFMAEYLALKRDRMHVVPLGLNLAGRAPARPREAVADSTATDGPPFTIGYLGRICEEKGLHQLAEAFCLLAQDPQLPPLRLSFAGYLSEADRPYLAAIEARLAEQGLAERFEYVGQVEREEKIAFLQSLDVMCAPSLIRESKGLPALEAWASGVPVIAPAHGVFPELIEDTGGGLLYEPHDVRALAAALRRMLKDPAFAAACACRGREAVCQRYHADLMAQRTLAVYRSILGP